MAQLLHSRLARPQKTKRKDEEKIKLFPPRAPGASGGMIGLDFAPPVWWWAWSTMTGLLCILEIIRCRAARAPRTISLSHVRAHTRVAGNELVDRLAKAAASDASFTGDGDLVAARAASEYADACAAAPDEILTADTPQPPYPVPPTPAPNPAAARGPPTPFSPPLAAHSLGVG